MKTARNPRGGGASTENDATSVPTRGWRRAVRTGGGVNRVTYYVNSTTIGRVESGASCRIWTRSGTVRIRGPYPIELLFRVGALWFPPVPASSPLGRARSGPAPGLAAQTAPRGQTVVPHECSQYAEEETAHTPAENEASTRSLVPDPERKARALAWASAGVRAVVFLGVCLARAARRFALERAV